MTLITVKVNEAVTQDDLEVMGHSRHIRGTICGEKSDLNK